MSDPYIGAIFPVAFGFAPKNFALCNGQLMGIAQNQALFSLLGTTYGGDGRTTFALPDLRGRTPVGPGANSLGAPIGQEMVTLTLAQLPQHTHTVASSNANSTVTTPTGNVFAKNVSGATPATLFQTASGATVPLASTGNGPNTTYTGQNQPHSNMQPYLAINYIICTSGIFPSRG